jgi:hypothetical protein
VEGKKLTTPAHFPSPPHKKIWVSKRFLLLTYRNLFEQEFSFIHLSIDDAFSHSGMNPLHDTIFGGEKARGNKVR